jgi:putative ABC transport system ATP-binding protein
MMPAPAWFSSAMSSPRIELRQLTRKLPSGDRTLTILDSVDVSIAPGEFTAVLGPSGSGKSTLLALMAGLDRPSAGEVLIDGVAIQAMSEDQLALLRREKIGFVFQTFQLLQNLTAEENVLLPLELAGLPDPEERAAALLASVGQQRVALARAFASRPPILLADEPTGNLDSATGKRVLEILLDLRRTHGTTLVLVTHDPGVAALADRLIHLRDGRVERQEALTAARQGVR